MQSQSWRTGGERRTWQNDMERMQGVVACRLSMGAHWSFFRNNERLIDLHRSQQSDDSAPLGKSLRPSIRSLFIGYHTHLPRQVFDGNSQRLAVDGQSLVSGCEVQSWGRDGQT
jgi:hypothetical protein